MDPRTKEKIESFIKDNKIALFMKGTKEMPQCGFSRQVVNILNGMTSDFATFDVLSDPEVREGIKSYTNWPTIPQLYVNQTFVGGCDIVTDFFENGELARILGLKKAEKEPLVNITQAACEAFEKALKENDEKYIRVKILANMKHELEFDDRKEDDFCYEFSNNVNLLLDPYSALRAEGLEIDFKADNLQAGFIFENPNALSASPREMTVQELNTLKDESKDFLLIDVRPKSEWDTAHISFAKRLEEMTLEEKKSIDKKKMIIFHCHHGGRSLKEASKWSSEGFKNVYNLTGGIDQWSKNIDPSIATY